MQPRLVTAIFDDESVSIHMLTQIGFVVSVLTLNVLSRPIEIFFHTKSIVKRCNRCNVALIENKSLLYLTFEMLGKDSVEP